MNNRIMILWWTLLFVSASASAQNLTNEECAEDNENTACCFLNVPPILSHILAIAGNEEPGERLHIRGTVLRADGKSPYDGVVIYAYHTNNRGIYPKNGREIGIHKWHGYLHSWGKTNRDGRFEIISIRPAPYPSRRDPAHIHLVVKEPNGKMYYINDITFADDALVKNKKGDGVISVKKNTAGVWEGKRTIVLRGS